MSQPAVSVVIPLYQSAGTLTACLHSLAQQTITDFEAVLVDSRPTDDSRSIAAQFAFALYLRVERRCLPQAGRNLEMSHAEGELLAFTDPDIRPSPSWLELMVQVYHLRKVIVFGSIACLGNLWIDRGVHLGKFHICLPGGRAGRIEFRGKCIKHLASSVLAAQ